MQFRRSGLAFSRPRRFCDKGSPGSVDVSVGQSSSVSGDGASSRSASGNPNCAERLGLGGLGEETWSRIIAGDTHLAEDAATTLILSSHMANFVKNCENGSYFSYSQGFGASI